jgi:hypothetical protein
MLVCVRCVVSRQSAVVRPVVIDSFEELKWVFFSVDLRIQVFCDSVGGEGIKRTIRELYFVLPGI